MLAIQPRNPAFIVLAIVGTVLHICTDGVLYRLPALLIPWVPERGHGAIHVRLLQARDRHSNQALFAVGGWYETSYHQRASLSLGRMYSGIKFRRAGRASYWSRSDLGRHRGRTGLVERSSRELGVRRLASRGLRRGWWLYCHLREACSLRFWLRMCVGPQLHSLAGMTLWRGSPKESYEDLTRGGHAFSGLNWNDSLKRTGSI